MTVGQKIKSARKAKHITQEELAERLGISYVNISQYENGKRNPKRETLDRIALALGVNPIELYDDQTVALLRFIEDEQEKADRLFEAEVNKFLAEYNSDMEEIEVWEKLDDRGRKLFSAYFDLNDEGQEKAVDYVQLLAENEKYLK